MLGLVDELNIVVMIVNKDLIAEIRATGARIQPISDGDVQAAIAWVSLAPAPTA